MISIQSARLFRIIGVILALFAVDLTENNHELALVGLGILATALYLSPYVVNWLISNVRIKGFKE